MGKKAPPNRNIGSSPNRTIVGFYPFDTRGLAASDTQMGDRVDGIVNDRGEWPNGTRDALTQRLDSLRMIADNTDGLAIINTNDLTKGAQRVVDRPLGEQLPRIC